jgi:hypothetical protein
MVVNSHAAHLVNIDKAWGRARKVATVRLWATSKYKRVSALFGHLTRTLDRTPTHAECQAGLVADRGSVRQCHDRRPERGSTCHAPAGGMFDGIRRVPNPEQFVERRFFRVNPHRVGAPIVAAPRGRVRWTE